MTEKTVTNAVVRVVLDGAEDVLGRNGLNALLNFGKMSHLVDNKPEFNMEKNFTDEDYAAITSSFHTILGSKGTKAILRQVGSATAKRAVASGVYDSLKEFKGEERLLKALEIYVMASGRGKAFMDGDTIVYDNNLCTVCLNIKDKVPICTIVNGIIDGLAAWAGIEGKITVETKCKAMGDDTCRHELLPKK
ncbi:MAG: hypothetical protein JW984_16580 [Deltaproteobacteria bacterium]|uniref:4-vinyl reductase 4VR domain-containing protein n=1 Tax=Candidatus Zymogenus saltonus TaxID=2844893 RepID=A0A9D8KJF6_9DELT|nr:hypothetical protein [Candidatus Zymogenus saltonus]